MTFWHLFQMVAKDSTLFLSPALFFRRVMALFYLLLAAVGACWNVELTKNVTRWLVVVMLVMSKSITTEIILFVITIVNLKIIPSYRNVRMKRIGINIYYSIVNIVCLLVRNGWHWCYREADRIISSLMQLFSIHWIANSLPTRGKKPILIVYSEYLVSDFTLLLTSVSCCKRNAI
jgi:hypothetical protein